MLMPGSRGAIRNLNTTGTVQLLCTPRLLQSNQEEIVFEVLLIQKKIENKTELPFRTVV